ncbi:MAG: AEC family transporter [Clostridia bacterium]|nr:AEC family transporter [Clostridia bacterium]
MFTNVVSQVAILLVLMLIGVLLTKFGVLKENAIKSITDLVLYTVTPCVIIKSFVRKFEVSALKNLLLSFLIAILVHIGFILLSRLIFRTKEVSRRKVLQFGVIFSNCGYMSLPLQEALLGDNGVFYGSSFIAIFNLFVWSYGILLMSGDKKYLTPKKMILNPGIIGLALGLIVFLFSVPLPKVIYEPISYMASLNTPLPMIIIGYHLTKSKIFKGRAGFLAIAVRLVLFPMIALAIMYLCGIRGDLFVSVVISCCAPTAALTTMFSDKFGCETALSVNLVSLSTIISLITIPLIVTLAQMIA